MLLCSCSRGREQYLGGVIMIIIEGPDGAGKSALISGLMVKYPRLKLAPRPCTSLGGPLAGKELVRWLEE